MILVTVGAQMPFDRLVKAVDDWAFSTRRLDVFAQIGHSQWKPRHIQWTPFLTPTEFRRKVEQASIVVAHAGMGTILTALELGKPILVLPRRGHLRETRNDHQLATARQFVAQGRIHVALDEVELIRRLGSLDDITRTQGNLRAPSTASPELITAVRAFIGGVAGKADSDKQSAAYIPISVDMSSGEPEIASTSKSVR